MQSNMKSNRQIIFLNPVFKQTVWGGDKLGRDWHYEIPGDYIGECWGVSAHPSGDCTVREGAYEGETLSSLWKAHPELFGDTGLDNFPLIVKIIDAREDLSIQVHPDDAYARANENGSLGKTECWYVLDCEEGSRLVIGHNAKDKTELREMIHGGRWKELLREVPVKKGDFIEIPPGTVHAIEGGIMVMETQQSSDITYRVYDYGRLVDGTPRALHIDKSIDVISAPAREVTESIVQADAMPENTMNLLCACDCYKIWKTDVRGRETFEQNYPFLIMSVIEGEGRIDDQPIRKGDHFILPAGYGSVELQGDMRLIASTI